MDDELTQGLKKLPKTNGNPTSLEEHRFISQSLKIGLTINDLKELEYKDVAKIMLCFIDDDKETNEATQEDIDRFLS